MQIIGEISVAGATYKAMEFTGSAIEGMNMDERMTVCNMVVEAGGKNGVIAPDQTTFDYVRERTSEEFEPVYTDAAANFCADYKWVHLFVICLFAICARVVSFLCTCSC
jgi:3-isopropylmalate/(R)-2-methylmalate dehydratase large subunit